jgi:DNA-binding transcriptional regulator YhcF (GntR family)
MMLGVRITLDPSSPEPLSEQLAAAIAERIRRGSLAPGARLPTVRALAEDLGLAANTVAKAYRAL